MHREIIIAAFERAKIETQGKSGVVPSIKKQAEYLSSKILELNDFSFGERSLRDLNRLTLSEKANVEIKQPQVVKGLCKYLGYEDYEDYVAKHYLNEDRSKTDDGGVLILTPENSQAQTTNPQNTPNTGTSPPNNITISRGLIIKISIAVTVITSIVVGIVIFNEQKWMEWKGDHYEKVAFDKEGVQNGTLKLYKEDRIENFRRIIADCDTEFFSAAGDVKIWYGKNKDGVLEYFTGYGLHPLTGKTLKPITTYMINKHICVPVLNESLINTAAKEVAILGFSDAQFDEDVITVIGNKLVENGLQPVSLFLRERLSEALKNEMKMGDFSNVPNLDKYVDEIWVITAIYNYKESSMNKELTVCHIQLRGHLYDTKTKQTKPLSLLSNTLKGSGYSQKEATLNALNKFTL